MRFLFLLFLPLAVMGQRVELVGRAAALVEAVPKGNASREVTVYRVEIFSGNDASARQGAYAAYGRFRALCPEVATSEGRDIRYNSPKYTVSVGMYLTHEEALVLCGRLKGSFPAYVRTEQRPLSTFSI